ncbi:hypothetical protein GJ496_001380 [Pomphorhynchus laevis]|nr:hypothetical protein GJ496_007116 [Pomphorhynchus laevis]KAI0990565.1 hypothetical protein GJ496_001380 [Pomphorhynchus laevis]
MLYRDGSIRIVCQHGRDNEDTCPARHEHYGLHGHEEESGDQRRSLYYKVPACEGKGDKSMKGSVVLLFESIMFASGFSLEHPESYAKRINRMIELGLGIDDDADELLDGINVKGDAAAIPADESDAHEGC